MFTKSFLLAILSSSAILALSSLEASAQTTNNSAAPLSQQTLNELQRDNQSMYSVGNGNFNVMELIHKSNLMNGKSAEEISRQQSESLNDAVGQFRTQQRQQLKISNPILAPEAPQK